MRLSLLSVLASGCIWVTDTELTDRVDVLEDHDQDGSVAMQYGGPDCDDNNAEVLPSAEEIPYDGIDNDCNVLSRDDDLDEDGFILDRDCDDANPSVHPDATEVCDGLDNDCDEQTDDPSAIDASMFYLDADGDGYGDQVEWTLACERESNRVPEPDISDEFDCNDSDASIYPGASEYCDDIDNDCDDVVDEQGAVDQLSWYPDRDGDGFGAIETGEVGCIAPSGYLELSGDCDDDDPNAHPDGLESLGDIEDRDCDGLSDGFLFTNLSTHSSESLVGPRMVMTSTSRGPLLYISWLAGQCARPTSGISEVLTDCMLFTTLDFSTWQIIQEDEPELFIETSDDEVEHGIDGDFVANPIYAAWVRDVLAETGPQLQVFGINRVTEETGEHVMNLHSRSAVSRVQAGLTGSQLSALTCSEGGELGLLSLALDDLVNDGDGWQYEILEEDIPASACEIDEYNQQVYTANYGGDFSTWSLDIADPNDATVLLNETDSDRWFLDLEHKLTADSSAFVGSHDDASSRLFYRYELFDHESTDKEDAEQGEDWVYTSEIFHKVDLTTTSDGVGWICGVTASSQPTLVSVDLNAINPVSEYPLSTSVGLGVVDDCAIASTTIEQDWISVGEIENVIITREVQVVVVGFRSGTVLKWGVVEAY